MNTTVTTRLPRQFYLPLFLNRKNKWPCGIIMFLAAIALYLFSNHYHIYEPILLPMSALDNAIPFMPNTVWIYLSEYFLFLSVYALSKDNENINKYIYSFFILQIFSVTIFILWPTTYPRELFPLTEDINFLTYHAFSNLRSTDSPASCLPSLHVSCCYLSAFVFLDEQRKKFPFFFLWATLIGITTLTTKQHYIIDVISGLILAYIFYWFFHKQMPYRDVLGDQAKR